MNEYEMEALLEQDRKEESWKEHVDRMMAEMEDDEEYEEEFEEEYDFEDEDDEEWDDWDDLFDGYEYEDPMTKAMYDVGMSWHDFI